MGYVSKTNSVGDAVTTLTFELYQDFLDFRQMEEEQEALDVAVVVNRRNEVVNRMFDAPQGRACHHIQLSEQEYYYLSCILGYLVPAGKISKSLLSKVSSYDLGCEDFDLVKFKGDEIGGYSITLDGDEE